MIGADSHRAGLFVELEESDQVNCRFLSPEQSTDEICAKSTLDTEAKRVLAAFDTELEFLAEAGVPRDEWLSSHRARRKHAIEALMRIGLPEPIDGQLRELRRQIGNGMLLLELSTNSAELDCLPWELLGGHEAGDLCNSSLVVWRYIQHKFFHAWPKGTILLVTASPPEKRMSPNVDSEFRDIRKQADQANRYDIKIEELLHSTILEFEASLLQTGPNVLHMAMHGDRNSMYFEQAVPRERESSEEPPTEYTTREREFPYDHLAYQIADAKTVLTAVLSVCDSASRDPGRASLARKLIEADVPSAIGMAHNVTPAASEEFCHVLYRELCYGKPIADAYGSAVVALRRMSSYDECLWSVPMLYGSDNVIPLPTGDYRQFLGRARQAAKRVEELRRSLRLLSMQAGTEPGNWLVVSTSTAMGLSQVERGLRYVRDNATATRAGSYLWRLEFDVAYRRFESRLSEVRDCMTELNQARGPTALSRGSQRFRSEAPRLMSELDNMRRLVINEFPVVATR
jgi:hypothetical protein